ncbi:MULTISPECIES: ANTAR domain-containing response regulator [Xanthobacter]|jgi:two-component system, response regulator / RNA-binding antiterminator|uniref:Response regulator NasT n=2 Tax=Xanthobacter TaxID=279 RepID=A0A9W6FKI1_XANFL|nr:MULTISPECIES: ANTAR domain-containing protein [Xanthobacter]MBN8916749.1 ANTAR domain-containing protein [Hyphomicrobiales bacterium]MBP2148988.1 response regulator NasT [Xanthobacter flavus]MCL8380770.1 ANTAR domain-containing protein [Xanthobacter aminoxidans]MDR6333040.1 response regulator NasT [Xanthobacter flavus]NMN57552.1 response regulator NasT [Xanthobacter sp. SG618]
MANDLTLRIVIVDESDVRAAILEEGLKEAGFETVLRITGRNNLLERIYAIDPDVILIDLEDPSRDTIEQMFQVSREVKRPVAMFVDQTDSKTIEDAIEAGVASYVVDGLRKERVKPILETTISRFRAFARLKAELEEAKTQLEERKAIDRAKMLLMKMKGIDEEAAYHLLRRTAMNEKKRIVDIAQSIITAAELLR